MNDTGNVFLDTLPSAAASLLEKHVEAYPGRLGTPIAVVGQPIRHVYFPAGCIISLVTTMSDGRQVEISVVGREGFHSIAVPLGAKVNDTNAMVQLPGDLWRVPIADFLDVYQSDEAMRSRVNGYVHAMFDMIAQFTGCNRLHPVVERCARWLSMAHDRVIGDELALTHDYLATMLGTRRAGVTQAALELQQSGAIDYHRGLIRVLDRPGLVARACECYAVANSAFARHLDYDPSTFAP